MRFAAQSGCPRDLTRRRKRILGAATSEKNRVQKILEDANVKLGSVLSMSSGCPDNSCWRRCCEATPHGEGQQMNAHHRRMIGYSLEHLLFLED